MLDQIKIASPCHVSWETMKGDERQRHCQSCALDVFNIADMTQAEAEEFLRNSTGRTCIRIYQRTDGTVLTRDCPKGLWLVRHRLMRAAAVVAVMMFGGLSMALNPAKPSDGGRSKFETFEDRARTAPVIGPLIEKLDPKPPEQPMMGVMPMPPSTTGPVPTTGHP